MCITDSAFSEDYVHVEIPERNGKTVAVIGAGPAGLVAHLFGKLAEGFFLGIILQLEQGALLQ